MCLLLLGQTADPYRMEVFQYSQSAMKWLVELLEEYCTSRTQCSSLFLTGGQSEAAVAKSAFINRRPCC